MDFKIFRPFIFTDYIVTQRVTTRYYKRETLYEARNTLITRRQPEAQRGNGENGLLGNQFALL